MHHLVLGLCPPKSVIAHVHLLPPVTPSLADKRTDGLKDPGVVESLTILDVEKCRKWLAKQKANSGCWYRGNYIRHLYSCSQSCSHGHVVNLFTELLLSRGLTSPATLLVTREHGHPISYRDVSL